MFMLYISVQRFFTICGMSLFERTVSNSVPLLFYLFLNPPPVLNGYYYVTFNLKSASNLNGNLNCSKELEHYAS